MGLKQDLLIDSGQMSKERIMKTQSFPLGQTIGKFSDKN